MTEKNRLAAQIRWKTKDRNAPTRTSFRPKAERSGLTGDDLREELARLRLSIYEAARITGMSGGTLTNYTHVEQPGRLPLWLNAVLRYAKLDPWFGRRLRNADEGSYIPLRGSDQDRWEEILIRLELLAESIIEEDPVLGFRRTVALIWSCRKMAAHMRRVANKYREQAVNLELIDS